MVCAVNTVAGNSAQVGLASMKADMHGLIPRRPYSRNYEGQVETVPTSGNSSNPVCFRRGGTPFFSGIVTVSVTILRFLQTGTGKMAIPRSDRGMGRNKFIRDGY